MGKSANTLRQFAKIAIQMTGISVLSQTKQPELSISNLTFSILKKKYTAEIYQDGNDAAWETNPLPVEIKKLDVTAKTTLTLRLATGGGAAIRFYAVNQ